MPQEEGIAIKLLRKVLTLFQEKYQRCALEERLAEDYDTIAEWDLEGNSLILQEENRLLIRFEETGQE
ncbi:MAG: hypothetical protein H0Z35_11165 [Thermoanaerobacteraceae bacterium]|nr:hypothetical protein [Thermoanaerobacteraceae bacterium]